MAADGMTEYGPSKDRGETLQSRIAGAALLTALVVLLAACVLFIFEQASQDSNAEIHHTRELAGIVGRIATPAISRNDRAALEQTLAAFAASRNVINASIIDTSGRPLADYHRAAQTGAAQYGSAQSGAAQPGSEGQARLVTRSEIKDGAATIGELVVIDVARDWTSILPRYMALTGALLFGAAGTALLVGRWLARRVVDPISKL